MLSRPTDASQSCTSALPVVYLHLHRQQPLRVIADSTLFQTAITKHCKNAFGIRKPRAPHADAGRLPPSVSPVDGWLRRIACMVQLVPGPLCREWGQVGWGVQAAAARERSYGGVSGAQACTPLCPQFANAKLLA